nr:hypothetical protein 2 [Deltaproteobacteria bacterium]
MGNTLKVNVEPGTPDTSAHDAEMAKRGEALVKGEQPPTSDNKKDTSSDEGFLGGKYKTTEELEEGYKNLQREYQKLKEGNPKEDNSDAADSDSDGNADTSSSSDGADDNSSDDLNIQAKDTVEGLGLDFDALNEEYQEAGELSEDTYKALEEKGLPKSVVDSYIAGQEALATKARNEVYDSVGGQETYTAMTEWASTALPPAEIEAYNKALEGSQADTLLAAKGLLQKFTEAQGTTPKILTGDGNTPPGGGYRSWAEVQADMAKPEYRKDPAFRKDVENKLKHSKI